MPYINDVLGANKEKLAATKAQQSAEAGHRMSRFLFDPEKVMNLLQSKIVGQPDMLEAVGDMLHVVKADFGRPDRPLAVVLFLGPTGVGKTETVRLLAQSILGNADGLCRIDMNTLAQEHYAAALTGAPPGYVGSKENSTLLHSEKIEGSYSKPGIVLFDEIEKASKEVVRTLLNVFDSGILELAGGTKQINFRNALIFMTSNLGAKELRKYRNKFQEGWRSWFGQKPSPDKEKKILQEALQNQFDPEFINRIDRVVVFERLEGNWLAQLVQIELKQLNERLEHRNATLTLSLSARDYLIAQYDEQYGARHLIRSFRTQLEPPLARAINEFPNTKNFETIFNQQTICLEVRPAT